MEIWRLVINHFVPYPEVDTLNVSLFTAQREGASTLHLSMNYANLAWTAMMDFAAITWSLVELAGYGAEDVGKLKRLMEHMGPLNDSVETSTGEHP